MQTFVQRLFEASNSVCWVLLSICISTLHSLQQVKKAVFSPHPDADPFIKDFMSGSCKCQQLSVGRAWLRVEALPSKDCPLCLGRVSFGITARLRFSPVQPDPPQHLGQQLCSSTWEFPQGSSVNAIQYCGFAILIYLV